MRPWCSPCRGRSARRARPAASGRSAAGPDPVCGAAIPDSRHPRHRWRDSGPGTLDGAWRCGANATWVLRAAGTAAHPGQAPGGLPAVDKPRGDPGGRDAPAGECVAPAHGSAPAPGSTPVLGVAAACGAGGEGHLARHAGQSSVVSAAACPLRDAGGGSVPGPAGPVAGRVRRPAGSGPSGRPYAAVRPAGPRTRSPMPDHRRTPTRVVRPSR
jgi:hypothetical protein